MVEQGIVLGHVVSKNGISIDPAKIDIISQKSCICISNHNKKEWNLVILTIVSWLDYGEGILSYMCKDGLSIEK